MRQGLEDAACECYKHPRKQLAYALRVPPP
jgi:hypothetical protein